ncbi:MAG TPA: hypothetical protein VGI39_42895 [Polyangiaceae bacterium]|jgi:hypothetical protein
MPRLLAATIVAFSVGLGPFAAHAAEPPPPPPLAGVSSEGTEAKTIVVWPTLTPAGDDAGPLPLRKPTATEPGVFARAQELDATLRDAVEDLGFVLDVADPGPTSGHMRDEDLVLRAGRDTWVVSARLEAAGGGSFLLRIVAVPRGSKELRVRVERVKAEDVAVRGLVMLRDLLAPSSAAATMSDEARCTGCANLENVNTSGLRSPGRAVLALNGAIFGGYLAYSLEEASGTGDPRVLYPLMAIGTGLGVATALLVSDEWDLSTGDAWFLSAGAWWGTASGVFVANGSAPQSDQFAYGVATGLGGLALATFALTRKRMDEGGAMLAHSGGAFGVFVGGLAELASKGVTNVTPYNGAGYGAAIGAVSAGTLATFVKVSPSRVLLIDMGAGVGALAGAAAGSPLVFENVTAAKNRGFLAATLGGTLAGGFVAWLITRDSPEPQKKALLPGYPMAGVIAESATKTGNVPAYGIGWGGTF